MQYLTNCHWVEKNFGEATSVTPAVRGLFFNLFSISYLHSDPQFISVTEQTDMRDARCFL